MGMQNMRMHIAKGRWFLLSEICSLTMASIPHTICMLKVLNLLAKTSGVGRESRGIGIGSYFPKFMSSQ